MLFSYSAIQQNLASVVASLYCLIHIHIHDFIVMYSKSAQEMFSLVHIQLTCTKNLISSSVSFQKKPHISFITTYNGNRVHS